MHFHVLKYIKVHKKLQLDFVKLRMGCSWYHMKAIYKNSYLILFTWIRSRTVLQKFVHYHKVLVSCLETKQRWKIENKSSKITYHALERHVQNHQLFFPNMFILVRTEFNLPENIKKTMINNIKYERSIWWNIDLVM